MKNKIIVSASVVVGFGIFGYAAGTFFEIMPIGMAGGLAFLAFLYSVLLIKEQRD